MSKLEDITTVIAPEIGLPLKVTRWIVDGVVILALVALVCWCGWKIFFEKRAAQAKHDQTQIELNTKQTGAAKDSGHQAVEITVKNQSQAAGIDRETQRAIHDLLKAPGANQPVDPALDALARHVICLRASAASTSSCRQLLGSDPAGMVGEGR